MTTSAAPIGSESLLQIRTARQLIAVLTVAIVLTVIGFALVRDYFHHCLIEQRSALLMQLVVGRSVDDVDTALARIGRRAMTLEIGDYAFPPPSAGSEAAIYLLPGDPVPLMVCVEHANGAVTTVDISPLDYR